MVRIPKKMGLLSPKTDEESGDGDEGAATRSAGCYQETAMYKSKTGHEYYTGCVFTFCVPKLGIPIAGTCLGNDIYVVWCGRQRSGKVGAKGQKYRPVLVLERSQVSFTLSRFDFRKYF